MLNSNPVDVAGLPSLDEESGTESRQVLSNDAAPVLDAFLQSCDAERFGIWSFRTLVRGIEWDPALFTRVLDECASKLEVRSNMQASSHMRAEIEQPPSLMVMCQWKVV